MTLVQLMYKDFLFTESKPIHHNKRNAEYLERQMAFVRFMECPCDSFINPVTTSILSIMLMFLTKKKRNIFVLILRYIQHFAE